MKSKKSQIWYLDVIIAVTLFTGMLIYFFQSDIYFLDRNEEIFDELGREGRLLTESLIGPGYPNGWNMTYVSEIGICEDYRINETKLSYLSRLNYNQSRSLLKTRFDYYLFFEDNYGVDDYNSSHEGIGKKGVNSTNIMEAENPQNMIKFMRFVIYKSEPKRMVLYIWE